MKVLVCDPIAEEGLNRLRNTDFIELTVKTDMTPEELKSCIAQYHAVIVRSATKITREIIEAGKNLKLIARAGVGLDNIDTEAAKEANIKVVNTPGATSISVAELVIGYMIAASRHIVEGTISLRENRWEKKKLSGKELYNKTLGIIGLGRIGMEVATRAKGLGMKILATKRKMEEFMEEYSRQGIKLVSLDELLSNSDYISIHLPLNPYTKNMISYREFEKMKDGVILINCSRGGIVEEKALYDALLKKKVAFAALDVFETEPPKDNPLLTLDNVIATPHIGAATKEGQERAGIDVADLIIKELSLLKQTSVA